MSKKWYGDIKVFSKFLDCELHLYHAVDEYPWDDNFDLIDPDLLPKGYQDFPIIKAAKKWKDNLIGWNKIKDNLKGGIL